MFLHKLDRCIAQSCIWLIIQIRPFFGPLNVCPYPLGCTKFALQSLQNSLAIVAIAHIAIRLLKCNPIYFYLHNHTNSMFKILRRH